MISPLDFSDPIDFLRAVYEEKRLNNEHFSMRAWARKVGFKNSASLWKIISGSADLGQKSAKLFRENLGLEEREKRFFDLLVASKSYRQIDAEIIEIVRSAYREKKN